MEWNGIGAVRISARAPLLCQWLALAPVRCAQDHATLCLMTKATGLRYRVHYDVGSGGTKEPFHTRKSSLVVGNLVPRSPSSVQAGYRRGKESSAISIFPQCSPVACDCLRICYWRCSCFMIRARMRNDRILHICSCQGPSAPIHVEGGQGATGEKR
ncbi:uncharacterized protein LY79DRAFT_552781 [Colletotrichum navitas]|uniref:Secreted protein n=1 Tax=Colletotrichum navitas TaxID=681940 RepID=A0AAD8PZP3_9PEZI|nr:uncharacterized protein LY79DRAFT_552781 [Colletotrichum navitas]KAK1593115.1 hypothetical protein LY79DRAFT_552781 [Colletotrichum navitas]